MRILLLIACTALFAAPSFSQELSRKEERKLIKQLKKEQQAEEAARAAELVGLMVHHRRFVLEADQLRDKRGNLSHVSNMINFVAADSIEGVIQVGSYYYVGLNGVGGVTVEGDISSYRYNQNPKNGSFNVSYNLRTSSGTYDVRMHVFPDGRADATISSTWPGRVTYLGKLVPPGASRVYQGRTSF